MSEICGGGNDSFVVKSKKILMINIVQEDIHDKMKTELKTTYPDGGDPARKRRRLNPRVVPVMFALLLFILIGGFAAGRFLYQKYSPSKEMADLNEYFGLESDQIWLWLSTRKMWETWRVC